MDVLPERSRWRCMWNPSPVKNVSILGLPLAKNNLEEMNSHFGVQKQVKSALVTHLFYVNIFVNIVNQWMMLN